MGITKSQSLVVKFSQYSRAAVVRPRLTACRQAGRELSGYRGFPRKIARGAAMALEDFTPGGDRVLSRAKLNVAIVELGFGKEFIPIYQNRPSTNMTPSASAAGRCWMRSGTSSESANDILTPSTSIRRFICTLRRASRP
jgi:hypothetical protein